MYVPNGTLGRYYRVGTEVFMMSTWRNRIKLIICLGIIKHMLTCLPVRYKYDYNERYLSLRTILYTFVHTYLGTV